MISDAGQPDSAMEKKGKRDAPCKLNNPLLFSFRSISLFSSFFSDVGKEVEERWDIVWEDVG
jgi:hypothetical protein